MTTSANHLDPPLDQNEAAARLLDQEEQQLLRRRVIDWTARILAIATLGGLGGRLLLAPVAVFTTVVTIAFAAGFLLVPWITHQWRSLEAAAVSLVLLSLTLLTFLGYAAGGLHAPVLAILPVVAAVAVPVLGGRWGWVAVPAIVTVLGVFSYLHIVGHPFERQLSEDGFLQVRALMLVIATGMLTAIVMMYERQNRRLRHELRDRASRDPLTGLANRRYSGMTLAYEWARASRDNSPMSLILFDIDHFKVYNDSFGHQAGDDCLREVADILRTTIRRATDLVARYGGEEFLAILPTTGHSDALRIAEELRRTIEERRLANPAAPREVITVSAGVATATDTAKMTSEQLVKQADRALYRAKESGRNAVDGWYQAVRVS